MIFTGTIFQVASVDEDMMDEYEVLPDMMEKRAYLLEPVSCTLYIADHKIN